MPDPAENCPICGKPAAPAARPFCSARCAQIDLGRWFAGHYTVAGRDGEALAEAPPAEE